MPLRTLSRRLLAASLLPLALTACSSAAKSAAPAAAPAAATTAAGADPTATASQPAGPNAHLPTGTQLKQALVPAAAFPAGYALDDSGSRDTGDTFQEPTTADVPKPDCTKLGGTSWSAITGIDGVSFAQNDYIDKNASAEIAQEVDVYQGDTAQTVLKALGMLDKVCPSYTDDQTHAKVRVTEKPLTGLGDGAYEITMTSAAWKGGTTLIAARKGAAVVTVLASSPKDSGAATAGKFAQQITGALPKAS
ncbi:hypothetical protein ABT095_18230 [Kitasatospora sp. NPDC002227]|uniref:hypothetical protein n=1 Tax=Kitasatospora sp. NPDC002227 TaxID=3154773 RepID=UPI00331A3A21